MSTRMMTTCVEKQHLRLEALHDRYADDCASLLGVIEREVAARLKAGMHWDKMSDVCDEVRESRRAANSKPVN